MPNMDGGAGALRPGRSCLSPGRGSSPSPRHTRRPSPPWMAKVPCTWPRAPPEWGPALTCWCSRLAALLHAADTEWCRAWSHLEPSNRSSKLPRDPRGDHTGDFSTRSTAAGSEAAMGRTASPTRASPRMCNRRRTLCRSEGKGGRSDHPRPIRRWSSLDQPRGEIQRWSQLQRMSQLQRGLHFQGLILLLQR